MTDTTTKASELVALRTIDRAANWVAVPEAWSSQGTFGTYPPGSENYSFGNSYMQWSQLFSFGTMNAIPCLESFGSALFAAESNRVLYRSPNGFEFMAYPGLPGVAAGDLHAEGTTLYYGCWAAGSAQRFHTSTNGKTWTARTNPAGMVSTKIQRIATGFNSNYIFSGGAGGAYGEIWLWTGGAQYVVYGFTGGNAAAEVGAVRMWPVGGLVPTIFAGAGLPTARISKSTDGANWTTTTTPFNPGGSTVKDLCAFGGHLYAGVSASGVHRTSDGTNWTLVRSALNPTCLCASDTYLYLAEYVGIGTAAAVMRTSNGTDWTSVFPGATGFPGRMKWVSPYLYLTLDDAVWMGREL